MTEEEQVTTSNILNICDNLTEKWKENKLDKIFNRDKEVNKLIRVLIKKKKNNAILIGEAGVGKTSIINALIERIENKDVPLGLLGKKILSIDTATITAGTKFRGEMEQKVKNLIEEIIKQEDIILFIDEIHSIKSESSASTSQGVGDILKPYLTQGKIQVIGATTYDDYKKSIEKDSALKRRFLNIVVLEPSVESCVDILKQALPDYERFHNIKYPIEIVEQIPSLAKKYIKTKALPDSAFDILDEIAANIKLESKLSSDKNKELFEQLNDLNNKQRIDIVKFEKWDTIPEYFEKKNKLIDTITNTKDKCISETDILKVVSTMSKIPLDKLNESGIDKVKNTETNLKKYVIGQDHAVEKIIKSLKRYVVGLNNPNKPISINLMNGVTGCGKTYMVQQLAKYWNDDAVIRIDMSEYQLKHEVAKLIGSPNGYIGHEDGGQLTEQVKKNPYSIILLDEVEKAHPDVLNILLQVFDNGELTDNRGVKVSFRNTIIFMTSNLGAKNSHIKRVGYSGGELPKLENTSKDAMNKHFTPEFINRIDNIIIFNSLSKENIDIIFDREIEKINDILSEKNVTIVVNKSLKNLLIDKGFDEKFGARPLKRAIESILVDPLTDYLLDNPNAKKITADWKNDKVEFKKK